MPSAKNENGAKKPYTYQGRQEGRDRGPDLPLTPHENGIGFALDLAPCVHTKIVHWADHVVELAEVRAPQDGEYYGRNERANEAFDCLLRRELDERCASYGHTPDVREDVVANDKRRWHPEPDQALEDVVYDEMAARDQNNMA